MKQFLLILFTLLLTSCASRQKLILGYANQNGISPKVKVIKKSKRVSFDKKSPTAAKTDEQTVTIGLDDLRIGSKNRNYVIKNYQISETEKRGWFIRKKDWRVQAEFGRDDKNLQTNIVAVLVLDLSESLKGNIDKVKAYAKDFASTILNSSPNSYVGLVLFSKDIETYEFQNKGGITQIKQNIDNYTKYKDRTTLFEASKRGLKMLKDTKLEGAKNLIIFTDGGDNNTDDPLIAKNQVTKSPYNRYAIGLKGRDFDKDALSDLASRKGNFVVAKNVKDLKDAFENIARQVATIYELDYKRSDQKLSQSIKTKYNFKVKKQRKKSRK